MPPEPSSKNRRKEKGNPVNSGNPLSHYARWSGLVFQMAAVVFACYFAGSKVDQWMGTENSPWTLTGVITGVIAAMVLAIRMVLHRN
jgi:hypothetical protein